MLLQRAQATAQSLSDLASSSYGAAQTRVHALSDTMLSELHKVQVRSVPPLLRIESVLTCAAAPTQASTAALPGTLQSTFQDVSANLTSTINELSGILTSPEPLPEKATKVREHVQERVQPLLDTATARVQEILGALKARVSEEKKDAATNGATVNGNGTA